MMSNRGRRMASVFCRKNFGIHHDLLDAVFLLEIDRMFPFCIEGTNAIMMKWNDRMGAIQGCTTFTSGNMFSNSILIKK